MKFVSFIVSTMLFISGSVFSDSQDAAQALIAEFNDAQTGIAFTMLSIQDWRNPGNQHFHTDPQKPLKTLQAVTITNAKKNIYPYPADTRYGLALSVAESSGFHQFFAMRVAFDDCSKGEASMTQLIDEEPAITFNSPKIFNWAVECKTQQVPFCGRCTDGGPCAGPQVMENGWPVLGDLVSYSDFQTAKNSIVEATELSCDWNPKANAWNEFDTNGLSSKALVGVLHDELNTASAKDVPTDAELCTYLNSTGTKKSSWPVLSLGKAKHPASGTQLKLERVLTCTH